MNKKISIGIIGGTGSMGRWFSDFFSDAGYKVMISGRKTKKTGAYIAKNCDVVILSVPLYAAVELAESIGPLLCRDQLLMDFCSLKETIVKKMLDNTEADVVGTHPLFGPYTDSIKNQNVILCRGRGDARLRWLKNELSGKGAVVTVLDPEEHDRQMAVVQALTHFMTICMGRTLQKMNMKNDTAHSCSTPVFRINHDLIGRLFAQDLELYRTIINENRHFSEVLDVFLSVVREGKSSILSGNNHKGLLYLENIREFFIESSRNCLEESNRIINALYGEE
jgi:prephenate dehydrogenase